MGGNSYLPDQVRSARNANLQFVLRVWIYKYQLQIAISGGYHLPPDLPDMNSESMNLSD